MGMPPLPPRQAATSLSLKEDHSPRPNEIPVFKL